MSATKAKKKAPGKKALEKGAPAPEGLLQPDPVKVRLADVKFAPYNPRVMPPEKMRSLKASLLKHGMVLNLVVQKEGMVIIGGHQRVTAARELCKERGWAPPEWAWAAVLDVDDATAKQLNVSLNNIEGEFDHFKLGALFQDILPSMTTEDVVATGFEADNLAELVRLAGESDDIATGLEEEAEGLSGFAKSVTLTVEFDTVEQRDAAKQLLSDAAKEAGRKAGALLLEALGRRHGAARRAPKATGKKRAA